METQGFAHERENLGVKDEVCFLYFFLFVCFLRSIGKKLGRERTVEYEHYQNQMSSLIFYWDGEKC